MKTAFTFAIMTLFAATAFAQSQTHQNHQTEVATATLTQAEQLHIAVQKICPVSGQMLGSMGDPIQAMFGEETAFLCCKGCQGKDANEQHWKTIQSNLATAQGTCPIMEKPVTAGSKSTVVNHHRIFVCCPPCIAKIQANGTAAMSKVSANYVSFVAAERQASSDQLHAAAQGICPVTGGKLGSMGAPIKVKVGEEEVAFLCCKGCVGKEIKAEHWQTIQTNLATAQGICPVMGKPVDVTMKSTVVNGRKIFVCCPPCIAKIEADPATYIGMVNAQIAKNSHAGESHSGDDHNDNGEN